MKKLLALLLALLVLFSFASCGNGNSDDSSNETGIEKLNLKMSFSGTDQGIDAAGVNKFVELVDQESNGQIKVSPFSGAQLAGGNMSRQLELLLQGGAFEIACLSEQVLAAAAPELNIVGVPFAFASYDDVYSYADGTGGEWMDQVLQGVGLKYLGTFSNGLVHITNDKREITSPEDIKGLKFRVFGEVQMKMMSLFGGDAVNMSWSEVYSAMQQGTIDGHLNPYASIYSGNIYEVQDYITELGVNWGGFHFVMNLNEWNKLSPEAQTAIENACKEAAAYAREKVIADEAEIIKACEAEGCTITTLTDEQKEAFAKVLEPLREEMMSTYGDAACAAWGLK